MVQLPLRVFTRGDRAVLVAVESPSLVGDRALGQSGLMEQACWRATVDPHLGSVKVVGREWELSGIVVDGNDESLASVCRDLWVMSTGKRESWAPMLHALAAAERIVVSPRVRWRSSIEGLLS